jgi:hypothetical protein
MCLTTVEMQVHRVVNARLSDNGVVHLDIEVSFDGRRQVLHMERQVEFPTKPEERREKVDALGRQVKSFAETWREQE